MTACSSQHPVYKLLCLHLQPTLSTMIMYIPSTFQQMHVYIVNLGPIRRAVDKACSSAYTCACPPKLLVCTCLYCLRTLACVHVNRPMSTIRCHILHRRYGHVHTGQYRCQHLVCTSVHACQHRLQPKSTSYVYKPYGPCTFTSPKHLWTSQHLCLQPFS